MPSSHRHTSGFRRNAASLGVDYEGDEIFTINGSGINVLTGETLTIDSGATATITGTLNGAGTVDLSSGTVTMPTRTGEFRIPLADVRQADGAVMGITETAGDHYLSLGTNQWLLLGEVSNGTVGADTEVSVSWFEFQLPENYVDGGTITIRAGVDVTGAGALGTCTIDFSAYLQDKVEGSVGSDLVSTAATAISKVAANKDFTVTPTGLVASDLLVIKMTTSVDNTDSTAIQAQISGLSVRCQVNK